MRLSPAALKTCVRLVRQHLFELRLVDRIGDDALAKLAFTRAGFRGQNMAGKCMITDDFAGPVFLNRLDAPLCVFNLGIVWTSEGNLRPFSVACGLAENLRQDFALYVLHF